MSKPGRNDPCPCGSGKKYKQCCLSRDQEAAAKTAVATRQQLAQQREEQARRFQQAAEDLAESMAFDNASNRVLTLIKEERLDEAESAARQLLEDYPDVVDGLERLGAVYEARGDHHQAAHYYRQALDFVQGDDGYDPEFTAYYQRKIAKLEPPQEHGS